LEWPAGPKLVWPLEVLFDIENNVFWMKGEMGWIRDRVVENPLLRGFHAIDLTGLKPGIAQPFHQTSKIAQYR
jgi:hypothetical protein